MSGRVTVSAEVDVSAVLARCPTDALIRVLVDRKVEEARRRALEQSERDEPLRDLAAEALNYLREGRADDARLSLERALEPKWKEPGESTVAVLRRRSA